MSYKERTFTDCLRILLTVEEQQAVMRQFSTTWKPIGESVNEIVSKLECTLDENWIAEYLAFHSNKETDLWTAENMWLSK